MRHGTVTDPKVRAVRRTILVSDHLICSISQLLLQPRQTLQCGTKRSPSARQGNKWMHAMPHPEKRREREKERYTNEALEMEIDKQRTDWWFGEWQMTTKCSIESWNKGHFGSFVARDNVPSVAFDRLPSNCWVSITTDTAVKCS